MAETNAEAVTDQPEEVGALGVRRIIIMYKMNSFLVHMMEPDHKWSTVQYPGGSLLV